jgi:hypothetical protein
MGSSWKSRVPGSPACTKPSTNASCQQEKAENWYAKTWGPASTPGVECATPRIEVSNEREGAARNRRRMWRIQTRAAASAAVKMMGLGVGTYTVWLPAFRTFKPILSKYLNRPARLEGFGEQQIGRTYETTVPVLDPPNQFRSPAKLP